MTEKPKERAGGNPGETAGGNPGAAAGEKPRIRLHVPPEHTPEEEAALVAQVAAAIADSAAADRDVEVVKSEEVNVTGDVAHRMHQGARWGA